MAAVFGLCGIHGVGETLTIQPHLPAHWKKVTLALVFRGQKVRITLTPGAVTVQPVQPLASPLSVTIGERTYPLTGELNISME